MVLDENLPCAHWRADHSTASHARVVALTLFLSPGQAPLPGVPSLSLPFADTDPPFQGAAHARIPESSSVTKNAAHAEAARARAVLLHFPLVALVLPQLVGALPRVRPAARSVVDARTRRVHRRRRRERRRRDVDDGRHRAVRLVRRAAAVGQVVLVRTAADALALEQAVDDGHAQALRVRVRAIEKRVAVAVVPQGRRGSQRRRRRDRRHSRRRRRRRRG